MIDPAGHPTVLQVCCVGDGGAAEHLLRLSEGLEARGWEVHVSCPPGWLERQSRRAGLRTFPRAYAREPRLTLDLAAVAWLVRLMRRHRYDIVHLHSSKAGAIGRVAARLAGSPAIYTPHAWSFLMDDGGPRGRLWALLERVGAHIGQAVICVSDAERRAGEAAGVLRGDVMAAVIPNGVDVPPAAGRHDSEGDGLVVGTVARLSPQKGIDVLVDAVPHVLAAIPDVRFVVVGDGPLADSVRARAHRLGVGAAIDFRRDLIGAARTLLPGFDVFALPSRWEGMPLALLEAGAAGLPAVATDVGGVSEVIDDGVTGRIVRPDDPASLAAALVELLSSRPLREAWGGAARERVSREFHLERMVRATEALYLETALAGEFLS